MPSVNNQGLDRLTFNYKLGELSKKTFWKGLIVTSDGSLKQVSILQVFFESVKGFFGIQNRREPKKLRIAALSFVAGNIQHIDESNLSKISNLFYLTNSSCFSIAKLIRKIKRLSVATLFKPKTKPSSNKVSDLFKKHGFTYLKHKTNCEKLPSILNTGYLFIGNKTPYKTTGYGMGSNIPFKVFFDVTKHSGCPDSLDFYLDNKTITLLNKTENLPDNQIAFLKNIFKNILLEEVTLIFKLNVLDNVRYHVSTNGWQNFGTIDPKSDFYSAMPKGRLEKLLSGKKCGEIVCYQDISISFLHQIWVHPIARDKVISYLKERNITFVNNIPIEDFVKANANVQVL